MRIEPTKSHGLVAFFSSACLAAGLFLMLVVFCGAARAPAQAATDDERVRALQNNLRDATVQHASPEQQGLLWRTLAVTYENLFDYDHAQDAYTRAISLLRNTARKAEYGESLHQAAEILGMQGRHKEALNYLAQARTVCEELGDPVGVAAIRGSIAQAFQRQHKLQEAEIEASAALRLLESFEKPDRVELENTYLTRARALAGEGHPQAALEDVSRAKVVAADPTSNEIDRITILLVQGEMQMQAGFENEGAQSMAESLKRARALSSLPPATSALLEASILQREALSMRKAHHKDDAKVLEGERKQALTAARAGCGGCTVSVDSLLAK